MGHIRDISHHRKPDLSRRFYERLKIVLDRLQFNRIISHTQGQQGLLHETGGYLYGLIYPLTRRPNESSMKFDDSHALHSHPDLPDALPVTLCPAVPDGIGGVPLFKH